jgi:hypothetical protein
VSREPFVESASFAKSKNLVSFFFSGFNIKVFKNKMRSQVVNELWVTEGMWQFTAAHLHFLVSYVKSLSELIHTFKNPIKEKGLLSDEELEKLFTGLDDIYAFHKILLDDITQRTKDWTSGKPIGDIFVKLVFTISFQSLTLRLHL